MFRPRGPVFLRRLHVDPVSRGAYSDFVAVQQSSVLRPQLELSHRLALVAIDVKTRSAPTPETVVALEARIARTIPLGRFGEPEQVAKTVLFLASDDASNIQAAEIFVGGGATGSGAPIDR